MNYTMTDQDHRVVDSTSIALDGKIGQEDDVERLMAVVENSITLDTLQSMAFIAVAHIRFVQDLKGQRDSLKRQVADGV